MNLTRFIFLFYIGCYLAATSYAAKFNFQEEMNRAVLEGSPVRPQFKEYAMAIPQRLIKAGHSKLGTISLKQMSWDCL